jgi:rhodanese-related sulfurtransferase
VVYCSNPACSASILAYQGLVARGYRNVRRYAGGLLDWEDAGYPLEGEAVEGVAVPEAKP